MSSPSQTSPVGLFQTQHYKYPYISCIYVCYYILAFAPRRQILIDSVNMPTKKPPKETNSNRKSSGISAFQLLIFLIATSSMAMNFAMLYGFIPIKGKNLSRLSAEAVRSVESLLKTF